MLQQKEFEQCAQRMKAFVDPARIKLIQILLKGEATVSTLAAAVDLELSMTSHHLGVLVASRIAVSRRAGRNVFYALRPEVLCRPDDRTQVQIDLGICKVEVVEPEPPDQAHSLGIQIPSPPR